MTYFVSYHYTNENGNHGWGRTSIERIGSIQSINDIFEVEKSVKKHLIEMKNFIDDSLIVMIINWRKFEE